MSDQASVGETVGWEIGVDQALASSDILEHARKEFPYPVARAVHELQRAHTRKDQYEALLQAAEVLAITFSVTTAAILQGWDSEQANGVPLPLRDACLSALSDRYRRGAMFGGWTSWLSERLVPLAESHKDLIPGLWDALQDQPDSPGLVEHLNFLRLERNRPAHFDRPQTQEEAELRAARCGPHLEQALRKAELLRNMPWLAIVSVKYRPKQREFDITAHRVMGDHPDFEPCGFTWTAPVASDALYVLYAGKPVTLSPFAASAFCAQCLRKEICYTQKLTSNKGPATLKSFDRGHEILNTELGEEIRSSLPK
ncbi:hypothetical protein [Streptomyces chartreusis]